MCDDYGRWAGIPFLHGVWYRDGDGIGVEFNHNIIGRKLKCYRVISEKETAKSLEEKVDEFGDSRMVCPNCGMAAIANPYRIGHEIYPYCPWCGQKLKEEQNE